MSVVRKYHINSHHRLGLSAFLRMDSAGSISAWSRWEVSQYWAGRVLKESWCGSCDVAHLGGPRPQSQRRSPTSGVFIVKVTRNKELALPPDSSPRRKPTRTLGPLLCHCSSCTSRSRKFREISSFLFGEEE
ncbi:hypothetical protein ElyMa_005297500 [Elysia marginata]|uniref:Uncharacterized protein n=1 Tax=Elysia marginata TaxID=1093978 RepID=A0AAV4JZ72_9GAST|nr:hypothetical protein ElyMa_005297500 [Elysia marginata]